MTRGGNAGGRDSENGRLSRSRAAVTGLKDKATVDAGLIVGIGASAGGLGAFTSFLSNMPGDSGLAFILVQHLSPDHKSILTDLLAKTTSMPVLEAEDGMLVEPNRVLVIPPDCTLTVKERRISISRPAPPRERGARSTRSFSRWPKIRARMRSASCCRGPERTARLA